MVDQEKWVEPKAPPAKTLNGHSAQAVTRLEQLYLHHVSNVDNESVLPGPHPHPFPRMSLDLQPTNFVLEGTRKKSQAVNTENET
jgi:hypothetical protein